MITLLIICVILQLIYWVFIFNQFVSLRHAVREAWSGVTVQLVLRQTIIAEALPTLNTSKQHESDLFQKLTALREQLNSGAPIASINTTSTELTKTFKQLFISIEANPQLKTDDTFKRFAYALSQTEDDVQAARILLNQAIERYNTSISQLPSNLLAKAFGYRKINYFEPEPLPDLIKE